MKLSQQHKQSMTTLISSLQTRPLVLATARDNKTKHVLTSRLANHLGDLIVITERGSLERVRAQYVRSLGDDVVRQRVTFHVLGHPLAPRDTPPGLAVVDVRDINAARAMDVARRSAAARCLVWCYPSAAAPRHAAMLDL